MGVTPVVTADDVLWNVRDEDYGYQHDARANTRKSPSVVQPGVQLHRQFSSAVLALAKTMTRPNPGDIMPFVSLSTSGVVSAGNPDLQPYFAEQADLALEWYFS